MFDVLHTVINSVYVQTVPSEQATPALTDSFSRGHDPFVHACKAWPLTIVGRTSLSVSLSLSSHHEGVNTFDEFTRMIVRRGEVSQGCDADIPMLNHLCSYVSFAK